MNKKNSDKIKNSAVNEQPVETDYKIRKRNILLLNSFLLFLFLLTGTFAWTDYRDHKKNNFHFEDLKESVMLVEEKDESAHWKLGEEKKNHIYVKNNYNKFKESARGDVYVRLSLQEALKTSKKYYIYHPDRYMLNEKGEFIRAESLDELKIIIKNLGLGDEVSEHDLVRVKNALDHETDPEEGYYYIRTNKGSRHGQYGKHIVKEIQLSDPISIDVTENEERTDSKGNISKQDLETHKWFINQDGDFIGKGILSSFVRLHLGNVVDVESYSSLSTNKKEEGCWILDTKSEQGYAYWNKPLSPNEETNTLLNSVELIKEPRDQATYILNVEKEIIPRENLSHWIDIPEILKEEWKQQQIDGVIECEFEKEMIAGVPFPIRISGFYDNGAAIDSKDLVIKAEGKYPLQYKDGSLISMPDETGPIMVNITHRDKDLNIAGYFVVLIKH